MHEEEHKLDRQAVAQHHGKLCSLIVFYCSCFRTVNLHTERRRWTCCSQCPLQKPMEGARAKRQARATMQVAAVPAL